MSVWVDDSASPGVVVSVAEAAVGDDDEDDDGVAFVDVVGVAVGLAVGSC